jgi:hypothetical protein
MILEAEALPEKSRRLRTVLMWKAMVMIAVIFESWPTNAQKYIDMGEALRSHLETLDGFISIERFRSVNDPAKLVLAGRSRRQGVAQQ